MPEIGKDISPGRARALQESAGNILPETPHMAPDGHPTDMAAAAQPPLSQDAAKPRASRPSPIKHTR